MPASLAALNCASASTGLPIAMMMASTFLAISVSNCSACFGSAPSEFSSVTFQPLALAAVGRGVGDAGMGFGGELEADDAELERLRGLTERRTATRLQQSNV